MSLDSLVLDSGRDDYYGHSGSWWDVQDSPFLARLDAADQTPPAEPAELTATSTEGVVRLSWRPSSDASRPVSYRVYRNGDLLAETTAPFYEDDTAGKRRTYTYAVRSADAAGLLSARPEVRFTVGLGIVDADGNLVADTVPPGPVRFLRTRATRTGILLSWGAASDRAGVKLYRVTRNGTLFALVPTRKLAVVLRRARGIWRVRAIDLGDNVGPPAVLRVRVGAR